MFASGFGTPVDPRNILRTIQVAAQKAGMSDIGVHTLRHSAAVASLETGVHIKAVADLLGHSSIAITDAFRRHRRRRIPCVGSSASCCARRLRAGQPFQGDSPASQRR